MFFQVFSADLVKEVCSHFDIKQHAIHFHAVFPIVRSSDILAWKIISGL